MTVDWDAVWRAVAAEMGQHSARGRGHLVTEDTLRFTTIQELQLQGISPDRLRIEYRVSEPPASLDLVIDDPPSVVIEFKFPRDATGMADTMTVGELLNDFIRLSQLTCEEAWAAHLVGPRLARHLRRRSDVRWAQAPGETLTVTDDTVAALPQTARRMLFAWRARGSVMATCDEAQPAGDWTLFTYRVARELPQSSGTFEDPGDAQRVAEEAPRTAGMEAEFHRAMVEVYERARREAGYLATRFIQMVSELGGLAAAKALLHAPGVSEGFTALWERERLDVSMEARVLEPRFTSLFTDNERRIAKERLRAYGFQAPGPGDG